MIYKERKCRVCGCTWHQACPGGCSWVEIDLCSACVGKDDRPGVMTPDESAAVVRKALGEPDYTYVVVKHGGRTITIVPRFPEAVRVLLEGYEAANSALCKAKKYLMDAENISKPHPWALVGKALEVISKWRGPEPGGEGGTKDADS